MKTTCRIVKVHHQVHSILEELILVHQVLVRVVLEEILRLVKVTLSSSNYTLIFYTIFTWWASVLIHSLFFIGTTSLFGQTSTSSSNTGSLFGQSQQSGFGQTTKSNFFSNPSTSTSSNSFGAVSQPQGFGQV